MPLTANQTSNMPDPIKLYDSNTPPPFPNGCGP